MSLLFIIPPQYIPTLARQQTGLPSTVRIASVNPSGALALLPVRDYNGRHAC